MLRDIAGIRLCGANFDEVTNILLLDPHEGNKVKPVKGTLLYGRNGAGKSTLAKAVRKAKGESQSYSPYQSLTQDHQLTANILLYKQLFLPDFLKCLQKNNTVLLCFFLPAIF